MQFGKICVSVKLTQFKQCPVVMLVACTYTQVYGIACQVGQYAPQDHLQASFVE